MTNIADMIAKSDARREADAARYTALDSDLCMLCGAYGQDKRSLWMDCGYAIHEAVPEVIDLFAVPTVMKALKGFYYLHFCKTCRAGLLAHLRRWRDERIAARGTAMDSDGVPEEPELDADGIERNVPVRINGALTWMTAEEYWAWDAQRTAEREAE